MKKFRSHFRFLVNLLVLLFYVITASQAQICTGSLGDPVVNLTFGSGPNPGPSLTPGTTTYAFTSSICPNDGFYTIVNNTFGCFGNSWLTYNEDHTPGDIMARNNTPCGRMQAPLPLGLSDLIMCSRKA